MFRPLARSHRRPPRKGTSFTLIAVSMLTLFAAVGMGYALFAHTIQKQTQANAEAQGKGAAPALEQPDPTGTANRFLGTLLFDDGNDGAALGNAMRGHSVVRSMYGADWAVLSAGGVITTPWAGLGITHEQISLPNGTPIDRARAVNFTPVLINGTPFLVDPEYTGSRPVASGALATFDPNVRNYVNKAAGYSYADLKDFFAAVVDPVTGQVLVPSFHRDWLFRDPARPPTESTLHPSNANWNNAEGKLLILRPRPVDHPNFPRIPQNADGGYSGDVQNLPGGVGPQRNDSLWMDIGALVFTWNGKRIKPLIAPLIVPLNGLLNASAHGRAGVGGNPPPASHAGIGPWEVNLPLALPNNGATIVAARGTPQQRNAIAPTAFQRAFAPFVAGPLPTYAPVAWRGAPVGPVAYPTGADLTGQPAYPMPPNPELDGYEYLNNPEPNHPSLFNPNQWPGAGGLANRAFALTDLKRLHLRYAFQKGFYKEGDLTSDAIALNDLGGTQTFFVAPSQTQAHTWRLDAAHANRLLVTPFGYDLQRPKLTPQFTTGALALQPNSFKPAHPTTAAPYPAVGSPLFAGTDFAAGNRWTNALAALGTVDLNRPLADYRAAANPAGAIASTNLTNAAQADSDRQALARDIFVRLVAATGGAATINTANGTITAINAAAGSPEYNALRYLAQVAVNAVDYIDNDDISTVFVWNPDATNPTGADFTNPADVNNRVAFGVEKPRLLINEAYGESANDPTDPVNGPGNGMGGNNPPSGPVHVRFWVELTNPANVPNPSPANNILGDGSVPLSAYRIEISRFNRQTGAAATAQGDVGGPIVDAANPGYTGNVTGSFDAALGQPDLKFPLIDPAGVVLSVSPNRGVYAPAQNALPANGFVLVGPEVPAKAGSDEFAPTPAGVWQNAIFSPNRGAAAMDPQPRPAGDPASNSMAYTIPIQANSLTGAEFKRHVVLLRRLANPYLPESPTNPFITVDVMDMVPAFDAVNRLSGGGLNRNPRAAMMANPNGYDPTTERFSVGKVQPFAGYASATIVNGRSNYNQYAAFPQSMVQAQTTVVAGQPKNTFGRHNGSDAVTPPVNSGRGSPPSFTAPETLMTPFDWYVHMDRPLVNAVELFHLRDSAAHHVSSRFLRPNAGALDYDQGVGAWRASGGLARALEFLTVKPHTVGVPHGGRVPGLINPNAVQDQRVLNAQFDPQAGNLFNATLAPNFMSANVWAQWMGTRSGLTTQTPAFGGTPLATAGTPGQSVYDANANAGQNRPFYSFGAPSVAAGSTFAFGAGGNENDTVLRRDPTLPLSLPYLFNTVAGGPAGGYYQTEPLRKTFNTTTTVNHQYAVFFTIGYFEVPNETPPAGWPAGVPYAQLGAEVYREVPGDMRRKFASVIDLSALALDPVANAPAGPTTAGRAFAPFFTTLESTTYGPGPNVTLNVTQSSFNAATNQLFVAADGQEIDIRPNDKLVIGYGADQQIVTVTGVSNGQVQVTADSGTFRTAWGGTCVSNVRTGYAGPQNAFNCTDVRFKYVVPYVEQLK